MRDRLPRYLFLITLVQGFIWSRSSLSKFQNMEGFLTNLPGTVSRFASQNPNETVKVFLTQVVLPNANLFGLLTLWGELLVALSITLSSLYLLYKPVKNQMVIYLLIAGLIGGMFLNIVFWLAAGWTSPSTDSVNLVMLGTQGVLAVALYRYLR